MSRSEPNVETATEKQQRLQMALEPVRDRFVSRCSASLNHIQAAGGFASEAGSPAFHTMVHRIAGMAGTFGLDRLGLAARIVDERLTQGETPQLAELKALEVAMAEAARP